MKVYIQLDADQASPLRLSRIDRMFDNRDGSAWSSYEAGLTTREDYEAELRHIAAQHATSLDEIGVVVVDWSSDAS